MAPGARLHAVKVLDRRGNGTTSGVIAGIDWVTANAATIDVANMSLSGGGTSDGNCGYTNGDAEHQAICAAVAAGVTFVVAAGNESTNAASSTPAAYEEVITVSALADFDGQPGGLGAATCRSDVDDTFADFSNYGSVVDIMAPGVCILSTWKDGGTNTISGTSMASPHVAGAAALYIADNPGSTPADVKAGLLALAADIGVLADDPDGIGEPLLDMTTQAAIHDAAIAGLSAPATAEAGAFTPVAVSVTAANTGGFAETFDVSLTVTDSGSTVVFTDVASGVSVDAGLATVLPFSWDIATAAPGSYTITAAVSLVDDSDGTNDSLSTGISLIAPTHDVAVTGLSAPANASPGDVVLVSVDLANEGTFAEAITLTLTDTFDGTVIDTRVVNLTAGATSTESISWDTAGAAEGAHGLVADATVAIDDDLSDNAGSTTVTLQATVALSCTVSSDAPSYGNRATVTLTINAFDGSGPVSGVGADIALTTPKAKVYTGSGATTDGAGDAVYTYGTNSKKDGTGTYGVDATVFGAGFDSATCSTTFIVN